MLKNLNISKKVLLTGAGFTKDFGGFLAKEMWSFIFNSRDLNKHPKIKNLLRNDFSYESVYHEIIEGDEYNNAEKNAINSAVKCAYDLLDKNIRQYSSRNTSGAAITNATSVAAFINEFKPATNTKSFFFTLNQDIFIERYCRNGLTTPGITLQSISQDRELSDTDCQQLPDENKVDTFRKKNPLKSSHFYYVKLHGSYHWRDSKRKKCMVIGKTKTKQISKEPLLKYYSDLFKGVLSDGKVELFIIGYGFDDKHINKIILDSITNYELKLYIMNPIPPDSFRKNLSSRPNCENLWNTIVGYYPYGVARVFPPDNGAISSSIEYGQIMRDFFER